MANPEYYKSQWSGTTPSDHEKGGSKGEVKRSRRDYSNNATKWVFKDGAGNDITINADLDRNDKGKSTGAATDAAIATAIDYILTYGSVPDATYFESITNVHNGENALKRATYLITSAGVDLDQLRKDVYAKTGVTYDGMGVAVTDTTKLKDTYGIDTNAYKPQEDAFNKYYRDIYDRNGNGLGAEAYRQMVQAELDAGQNQIDLAQAQSQQLAMQQAASVKAIADQIRSDRMSKLKAGMSESQLANDDMKTMLTNASLLGQQTANTNMAALQGQQQINSAQATAYNNWLQSMNQTATAGSAFAASDAGDINMQALNFLKANPGYTYEQAVNIMQGNNKDGTVHK